MRSAKPIRLLLVAAALAGLVVSAYATERASPHPAELTDTQIRRFIDSYPAAHTMASGYWGKRRYTPANKMLEPEGSFKRAIAEMKAAGTLPEFENLLQSYGFDDSATWMSLEQRILMAYATLLIQHKHPDRVALWHNTEKDRLDYIAARRARAQKLPPGEREQELEVVASMQASLDREILAEHDSETLRPYFADFRKLDKYLKPKI